MRVLLTGATGYTGLIVASRLVAAGVHVRGLASRPSTIAQRLEDTGRFTFSQGDLRDVRTLTEAVRGVDMVVHLAAVVGDPASASEPELARQVNVDATKALFDAADRSGVRRLIFASTCSVYGRHTAGIATEATAPNPISLYGETKVEAERHLLKQDSHIDVTVLRLATAYGVSPRMRLDLIVNTYVHQATQGQITVMGPQAWRPHVHVQDIAEAVHTVLAAPTGTRQEVFNVVTENLQLQHVAALAAAACPEAVRIRYRATVDDRRDYAVSGDKLRHALGFTPSWTVARGVVEIRDHLLSGRPPSQVPDPAQTTHIDAATQAGRLAALGFPDQSKFLGPTGTPSTPPPSQNPKATNRLDHGPER